MRLARLWLKVGYEVVLGPPMTDETLPGAAERGAVVFPRTPPQEAVFEK
jgi:hypothetical protein